MQAVVGAQSDIGLVRADNEDSFFAGQQIWAVADGMGGQAAGGVASNIVVDRLRARDAAGPLALDDVRALIDNINEAILDHARHHPAHLGLGSTVSGIASIRLDDVRHWGVFNVGDSRVYRFVDGTLTRETCDHNEAAELEKAGILTHKDAACHPGRFILTRALGSTPPPVPDIFLLPQTHHDTFLICSDGLTSEVSDDTIACVLRDVPDPRRAANKLVELCLEHGAHDNVTAVVLSVLRDSDTEPLVVGGDEATIPRPCVREK